MMEDTKVISKGSYSTFRFNDFVSVRQYLLVREKGEKYLLLKLSNDAKETVTGIKLSIEQLDVRGVCVETTQVEWDGLSIYAGTQFVAPDKIRLRENCIEVKINLVGATYGEYTYAVKSNELVVVYDKKTVERDVDYSVKTEGDRVRIRERKFKRPFSVIVASLAVLVCALVGTMLHLYGFKRLERQFTWKGVEYEFVTANKEVGAPIRIVGYTGGAYDVVIPAELEGYPITGIAASAFRGNPDLHSLKIEANVEIAGYAFEGCSNLETVELRNVTRLGEGAFAQCVSLNSVALYELQSMQRRVFADCYNLRTLTVEGKTNTLTLGNQAFLNCQSLETVSMNQSVRFPREMDAFIGVSTVKELTLKHYNSALHDESTEKTVADFFAGADLTALESLTIYDIDAIPEDFCAKSYELKTVSLQGLESGVIADRAFFDCTGLTDLSLQYEEENAGVTEVGDYAFNNTKIYDFNGKQLTEIGDFAFANNPELTTVDMTGNTVLSKLGEGAFKDCSSLQSFYLAKDVTILPAQVFKGCQALRSLTVATGSALRDVGEKAFYDCENLAAVTLPFGTQNIGESAFENCKALTSIGIPTGVKTVGECAFANCQSLTDVKIPSSVTSLGASVLQDCNKLQTLETPFAGTNNGGGMFLNAMFGGTWEESIYCVPETLHTVTLTGDQDIAEKAFYGLNNIKRVSITGGTESIGNYAFFGCRNLRELRLGTEVESIGEYAFYDCYLLFEVWNHSSALNVVRGEEANGRIAKYALAVYAPEEERFEMAEKNGFQFLNAEDGWYMTDYVGTSEQWKLPTVFSDELGENVQEYVMVPHLFEGRKDVKTLNVSSGVKAMGEYVFASCENLTRVSYDANVQLDGIAYGTYLYCGGLTAVELPASSSITTLGDSVFEGCSSLQSITLPDALQEVGCSVFRNCSQLTDLTFGENVETIGLGALYGTTELKTLTVPFIGGSRDSNTYLAYLFDEVRESYHSQNLEKVTVTSMENIPERAFYQFSQLQSVVLKQAADTVGQDAFGYCHALQSVAFENGVKTIDAQAFVDCNSLQSVSFGNSLETIGARAFIYCHALQSVDLPQSLTYIGELAFYGSGLESITFPQNVQIIEVSAFANTQLTSVKLPTSLQTMGASAFSDNTSLTSVDMTGVTLQTIPQGAFNGCSALEEVSLNHSAVTAIETYAFAYTGLTNMHFPVGLQSIGYGAFQSCNDLELVTLPDTLTEIGNCAFEYCSNLHEVYNLSGLPIERGKMNYGYVAYNAVIVHTSATAQRLIEATVGDMIFKYAPTEEEACLLAYQGSAQSLQFQAVTLGGKVYDGYWIYHNAFGGQSDLTEMDTGVVYEIARQAFYNCSNLKKVTLRDSLAEVGDYAFERCTKLWEVWDDNTAYDVTCGGSNCGGVAYYALAINESIHYSTEDDFEFIEFSGTKYLYGYTQYVSNSEVIALPEAGDYVLFSHPKLSGSIFPSTPFAVVIPEALQGMQSGALSTWIERIYYKGSAQQWAMLAADMGISESKVYYYNDCVHNNNFGTQYWSYQNDRPSIEDTELTFHVTEATCQQEGLEILKCDTCDAEFARTPLPLVHHSFTGKDGACKWCGQTPVASDALGVFIEVQNDGSYPFFITNEQTIYSDWRADYDSEGEYTAELRFVAKADILVKCDVRAFCLSDGECRILINGKEIKTLTEKDEVAVEQSLTAGDILTFVIKTTEDTDTENRMYVENIQIDKIGTEEE